jgi:hypothetical protein
MRVATCECNYALIKSQINISLTKITSCAVSAGSGHVCHSFRPSLRCFVAWSVCRAISEALPAPLSHYEADAGYILSALVYFKYNYSSSAST